MVEIEAKITFTRLLCSCPCILTWTHLITQKNRCLQTYTYRLYTHSHEYAGLYWSADTSGWKWIYTWNWRSCATLFINLWRHVFHILHYKCNSVRFGFMSQLYKIPAHAFSSQIMLWAPFTWYWLVCRQNLNLPFCCSSPCHLLAFDYMLLCVLFVWCSIINLSVVTCPWSGEI